MKRRGQFYQRTSKPLPIEIIQLPELIAHNPISWCIVLSSFVSQWIALKNRKIPVVYSSDSLDFRVTDPKGVKYLWSSGYFGKGSLSRSDPTWLKRTKQRVLGIQDEGTKGNISEEITKQRRKLRNEFKKERTKLDELEKRYKLTGDTEKLKQLEEERHRLTDRKNEAYKAKKVDDKPSIPAVLRREDLALIIDGNDIRNLEYLELMPVEALFLSVIGSIDVISNNKTNRPIQLFKLLCETYGGSITPNNSFIFQFLVYFHYRSLGWCARSGMKFSSDYILYERGPPFQHAKFAVTIVDNSVRNTRSWCDYGSSYRVISGVKKAMILCFVDVPSENEFTKVWNSLKDDDLQSLKALLSLYSLNEVMYNRWSPARTRE